MFKTFHNLKSILLSLATLKPYFCGLDLRLRLATRLTDITKLFMLVFSLLAVQTAFSQEAEPDTTKQKPKNVVKSSPDKGGKEELPKTESEEALELYVEAMTLKDQKNYKGALENLTLAIEKDDKFAECYLERAGLKFLTMDFAGALADYDKCIEVLQEKHDKYQMQGDIKKILDDMPSARLDYEKVSQIKPTLADAYYRRGNVKRFMDRKEGGCEDLEKAKDLGHLKANPDLKDYCN